MQGEGRQGQAEWAESLRQRWAWSSAAPPACAIETLSPSESRRRPSSAHEPPSRPSFLLPSVHLVNIMPPRVVSVAIPFRLVRIGPSDEYTTELLMVSSRKHPHRFIVRLLPPFWDHRTPPKRTELDRLRCFSSSLAVSEGWLGGEAEGDACRGGCEGSRRRRRAPPPSLTSLQRSLS